jgi:hypothetical protein
MRREGLMPADSRIPTAVAAAVVAALVVGGGVSAATGDSFVLGNSNSADNTTTLTSPTNNPTLRVTNTGTSAALRGDAQSGTGVNGTSVTGTGQQGASQAGIGLLGQHTNATGTNPGVQGTTASADAGATGVLGRVVPTGAGADSAGVRGINNSTDANGAGVLGSHSGSGPGVKGTSASGPGVRGDAPPGFKAIGVFGLVPANGQAGSAAVLGVATPADSVYGVRGDATGNYAGATGVFGMSDKGVGVEGSSTNIAGRFLSNATPDRNSYGVIACGSGGEQDCGSGLVLASEAKGYGGIFHGRSGGVGVYGCADAPRMTCLPPEITAGGQFATAVSFGRGVSGRADADYGIGVEGSAAGLRAIGVRGVATGAASFAGKFEGNVHVTGTVTKAYSSFTSNLAIPIAYGTVSSAGTLLAGTPNVSVTYNAGATRYEITISGETYDSLKFVTNVTRLAGAVGVGVSTTTSSPDGKLLVFNRSAAGSLAQGSFHFLVYKP